jgi:NitT/TauT family transport system permease protein
LAGVKVGPVSRAVAPFVVVFLAWVCLTECGIVDKIFLPRLADVFEAVTRGFAEEEYHRDLFISIFRVTVAFLLSVVLAIPLGLLSGFSQKCAQAIEPFVGFVRYLPIPAFVPLCILWFGLGNSGKIVIIFLGTFFQLVLMIADVARQVPRALFEAALTLGATTRELFLKVLMRSTLPGVVNSCRVAMGWAWTYLVVAEIAGATSGLGFRIMEAQRFVQTPKIFAGILLIGILGVVSDLAFQVVHRFLFPWSEDAMRS